MMDRDDRAPAGERLQVRLWDIVLPLIAVGAVIGLFAGLGFLAHRFDLPAMTQLRQAARSGLTGMLGFIGILYLVMLAALWHVCRRRGPATLAGYFADFRIGQAVTGALSGVGAALLMMAGLAMLMESGLVSFHPTAAEQALGSARDWPQFLFLLLVTSIAAPLAEEVYFRGLLLAWLRRRLWLPLAGLADAVLFALLHGRFVIHPGAEGWVITGIVGTVGLLNVAFYLRTSRLWMPFATHAFYNGTLLAVAFAASLTTSHAI
jgi:hypothetical protein